MLYNILFVISKCIKPFFKDKLLDIFTITEDIIMSNFIFFLVLYYIINIIIITYKILLIK